MRTSRNWILAGLIVAAAGLGLYLARAFAWDACLDAGGMIEHTHRHRVDAAGTRTPLREPRLLLAGLGAIAVTAGWGVRELLRRRRLQRASRSAS